MRNLMKTNTTLAVLSLVLGAAFAPTAAAQEVLPASRTTLQGATSAARPRNPSRTFPRRSRPRKARRTSCSSSPTTWASAPSSHVRRADPDADDGPAGEGRPALHAVPHHGALLADARGAAHRAQPPLGGHRRHHGTRHRLPRLQLAHAEELRDVRRGAQAERLEHRLVRQEPQRARLAHEPGRAVRPLADRAGLRILLRLHRRRRQPVGAGALREHQAHRAAARREGLLLRQGHGRPLHRPHPHAATPSRPTSRCCSTTRRARPTRRTTRRRSGSRSSRASSTRAGTRCARRPSRGRSSWASSREHEADAASRGHSGVGQPRPPTRRRSSPA